MYTITPIYRDACPVCGEDALSIDIELHGSCSKCIGKNDNPLSIVNEVVSHDEKEFVNFFVKTTSLNPWGAQRHWLKRLLRGENTVLVAPTGIGKTTLLIVYALYSAIKGKKVLYVTPTRSLMHQTLQKLREYSEKVGSGYPEIVCYDSSQNKKKKEAVLEKVKGCNYNLLLVTNRFLLKNHDLIKQCKPDLVVVDDVDSLIKSDKSAQNLIKLLGFSENAIELAKKRMNILWRIVLGKVCGKKVEELVKEYIELDRDLEIEVSKSKLSQLVVASATGKSRGLASKLLRDLLKIDLSGITIYGRNITDCYKTVGNTSEVFEVVLNVIKKLGKGCILYLSPRHPYRKMYEELINNLVVELARQGYSASKTSPKSINNFTNGRLDILVGYSTYYGSSVRGLDAPKYIKYVVFLGTPVFSISLENFLAKLNMLTRVLIEVSAKINDPLLKKLALEVRRKTLMLSPSEKKLISFALIGKIPETALENIQRLYDLYLEIKEVYTRTLNIVKEILDRNKVLHVGTLTLIHTQDRYLALIPDTMTYVQASGRTSRLVGNKMTHGLSFIVELSELSNLIYGLEQRLRIYSKELSFKLLENTSLEEEMKLLRLTREGSGGEALSYRSILLVVESPTKAKSITRFFGKPSARRIGDINVYTIPAKIGNEVIEFNVVATRGHLYDLVTNNNGGLHGILIESSYVKPIYTTIKKCKLCGTQFLDQDKCPRCGSIAFLDSKYIINVLRKLAMEVDEVYIATDPDLEGEKIAYDVYVSIYPLNRNVWRIELHEITLQELLKAIRGKRSIDKRLVEAEMYRRVLDRLVGFALSKKLQVIYGLKFLGAGRVQTPVLGLIIDRYKEHLANKCKRIWLKTSPFDFQIALIIDKNHDDLVEKVKKAREIELLKISEEVIEVLPKPPYTTDELLSDASKIGLPVEVAIKIAQDLFEAGLITYHRTDSTYVSSTGINLARDYLTNRGLLKYFKPSHWGSQGTHEAIRPVYPLDSESLIQAIEEGLVAVVIPLTKTHFKLYDLIFKRFIASQLKGYKVVKGRFSVILDNILLSEIELTIDVLEDGFNLLIPIKVYRELRNMERVKLLISDLKIYDSSKTPLYTDGDVVTLMKKLGIGRPSTYAKILSSIKGHGYVIKSKNRKKLIPTKRGVEVYSYLNTYYSDLISVEVTRKMENIIEKISRGEIQGVEAVQGVLVSLVEYGLIERELIPSLDLDSNIRLDLAFHNIATN